MKDGEVPVRIKEAARIVGLSPRTLRCLKYSGELDGIAHRYGKRLLYFYPSELLEWLRNRGKKPHKKDTRNG